MRILLVSAAVLLSPAIAAAETYDVLSWSQDRLAAIDRDSLVDAGSLKRVRIAVVYSRPRGEGAAAYRGMVGLQEFDCDQGRYHTLDSEPFDDQGAPIPALATREPTAWSTVAPGTLGADERERVCDGRWPAAAYQTKLSTLVAAYLLRPERDASPGVHAAAAQDAAADAAASR